MSQTEKSRPEQTRISVGPRQTIRLRRCGQFVYIRPAVLGLEGYFFATEHAPVDDPRHGMRVEKQGRPLVWHRDRRGERYSQCYAGLEPQIRELLETAGFEVLLENQPTDLASPLMTNLTCDLVDEPVLDWVQRHDRGLIRYIPDQVDPARIIAQMAKAWPKARIIAVATRISEARELQHQLADLLGCTVKLFTGKHHPARGSRVVVATYNRLGDGAIGIERRNIYVALHPHEIFATYMDVGLQGISKAWKARMYGLLADDIPVAPNPWSWMMALFGLDRIHIPQHGWHDMPVDVVMSRVYGGERPPHSQDDLLIKRLGVWQHRVRNRRISELFQAMVDRDRKTLCKAFPDIAKYLHGRLKGRIGLLVEGVEHGLRLARLLPDVEFVTGPKTWTEGLSRQERKLLRPGKSKPAKSKKPHVKNCAIVTHAGLARAERFDVLIRADGGSGVPELPETYRMVPNDDKRTRLLIIDFRDEHHPVLRKWSRLRREAYIRSRWTIVGRAAPGPMDRFVAERPEVG